jgi:hypothetical protein
MKLEIYRDVSLVSKYYLIILYYQNKIHSLIHISYSHTDHSIS